jgi:hypothetical protein
VPLKKSHWKVQVIMGVHATASLPFSSSLRS